MPLSGTTSRNAEVPELRLEGLVLSSTALGECDRLLTLLSGQEGVTRLAVPGARRPRSSLAAAVPMVATADPFSCAGPRRHPCDRCWLCFAHLPVKDRRCPLCGGGRCASCADDGGAGVLAAVPRGRCALCGVCVAATPRSLAFPDGPFC